MTEDELTNSLAAYLQSQGYVTVKEVSNMGQSVDLVAIKDNRTLAIEVKLRQWRRALEQCKPHELVSDFTAIAMPGQMFNEELKDLVRVKGWGLILWNDQIWQWDIQPRQSTRIWTPQQKRFRDHIDKILFDRENGAESLDFCTK